MPAPMIMIPKHSVIKHFVMSPSEIHFLCFILEAYEGIGKVTTLQPDLGLIRLSIAPGCEEEVGQILQAERERLQMRAVTTLPFFPYRSPKSERLGSC